MEKRFIKRIAIILLFVVIINTIFVNPAYAERNNENSPTIDLVEDNTIRSEQRTDENGEPEDASINISREQLDSQFGSGEKKSFGKGILIFIANIIASISSVFYAAQNMLMTLMYWEEMPKDLAPEEYEGKSTVMFTIENLVFNRVKILDSNFFKKSENPNGYNQQLKNNVAKWHNNFRLIALILLIFILMYLAIKLIIASVQDNPGKRATIKLMLIDVVKGVGLCLLITVYIAFIFYLSDILVNILTGLKDALTNKKFLNFEKVIIYKYYSGNAAYNKPAEKLINIISFIMLVSLQTKFLWMFVQRFFTLAFLTVLSPLIAITYAVDNFEDGESQVLKSWAAEIAKTTFLVPLYALIYLLFAVQATALASKVPMLGLIFLMYFGRIEKIIKGLFGVRDLQTVRSTDAYDGMDLKNVLKG